MAQLIGAAVVPATFQLTATLLGLDTSKFSVIVKAEPVLITLNPNVSTPTQPFPSLTTRANLIERFT